MSARKKPTPAQVRERRARIAAVVLGVVLLGIVGVELPGLLHRHGGGPAAVTLTAPPAAALASATPPAAVSLTRLSRFETKDPFVQQAQTTLDGSAPLASPVTQAPTTPSAGATGTVARAGAPPVAATTAPAASLTFTPTPAAHARTRRGILLLLGGKRQGLLRGDLFPAADPTFRLVSFTATTARVALLAGTLDGGGAILKLHPGRRLVLRNATSGQRYVLEYVRVAQVLPRRAAKG